MSDKNLDDVVGDFLDTILMKCVDCMGYSTPSKYAVKEINECDWDVCPLYRKRADAIQWFYGPLLFKQKDESNDEVL
jgi:hypothetical protein